MLNLKMWPQNPKSSQSAKEVGCSLVNTKGMESSVSNFSGNDYVAELGAEAVWENFATCCKLPSIEITAM